MKILTPCNYSFIVSRAGTQKHNKLTIGTHVMRISASVERFFSNYSNCKTASLQLLYHISRASCHTPTQPNAAKARRGGGGIVWGRRCCGEGGANSVPSFLAICARKVKGHVQGTQKKLRKIMRPISRNNMSIFAALVKRFHCQRHCYTLHTSQLLTTFYLHVMLFFVQSSKEITWQPMTSKVAFGAPCQQLAADIRPCRLLHHQLRLCRCQLRRGHGLPALMPSMNCHRNPFHCALPAVL